MKINIYFSTIYFKRWGEKKVELCQVCILPDITVHEGCHQNLLADVGYSGDILYGPHLTISSSLIVDHLHLIN